MVEELDCAISGAMPFLSRDDISVRGAKNQIICHRDGTTIYYKPVTKSFDSVPTIRRSVPLRADETRTSWPGDSIDFELDDPSFKDREVAVEPRFSEKSYDWLEPSITS